MICRYYSQEHETCTNDASPYCADFCPMYKHQEVCRYARKPYHETNLEGKCGSCAHSEPYRHGAFETATIRCKCPKVRRELHPRTEKCCMNYKRSMNDETA